MPETAERLSPQALHDLRCHPSGTTANLGPGWIIYHMHRQRRLTDNRALAAAVAAAKGHRRPLLIIETLPCTGPWRARRHHHFAIQGMQDTTRRLARRLALRYLAAVETKAGQLARLWRRMADLGALLVSDQAPGQPSNDDEDQARQAFLRAGRPILGIDDQGLLPLRLLDKACPSAAVFRRHLHRQARAACCDLPPAEPLAGLRLPPIPADEIAELVRRNPPLAWAAEHLSTPDQALSRLPIDQGIAAVDLPGGESAAQRCLERFLDHGLGRYDQRNHPDQAVCSGLSPYLRWGHIGTTTILRRILATVPDWDPLRLPERGGARQGFWPLPATHEAFLDQLLTWRELGQQAMARMPGFTCYGGLPAWARAGLEARRHDPRPALYSPDRLEAADTDDPLWNAAQRQLRGEGIIHNYLRMLWGKNLLLWSTDPAAAYDLLVDLNNRYALDGCDPNSWSGIGWCFGLFDHPWPARPIYGPVRCMTSASTRRKLRLDEYLQRWGADG